MSCSDAETVGGDLWLTQLITLLTFVPYIGPWCGLANLYFFMVLANDVQCLIDAGSLSADGFQWMSGSAPIIWYVQLAFGILLLCATVFWALMWVFWGCSTLFAWIPALGQLFWLFVWFCWYVVWWVWAALAATNFWITVWIALELFLNMPAGLEPYTGAGVSLF